MTEEKENKKEKIQVKPVEASVQKTLEELTVTEIQATLWQLTQQSNQLQAQANSLVQELQKRSKQ